ncbi:MAG: ubiquinone/menaquinone biosynthesis methyltransferase [Gemmatimonadaceae bacterium]
MNTPPAVPPPPSGPSPRELARLDLESHLTDPARKQAFVTPMFEHIAPRYDDFTRLFSFGMDARWKAELMAWFERSMPLRGEVLDVACGTGDLAFAAAHARPEARVRGVDTATGMVQRARQRVPAADLQRVTFEVGDLTQLPFPDGSVDAVLAGYALRNVPDHAQALRELRRVLRPGGHLYTLDFHRPRNALWRELFLAYLQLSGGLVGWWWHRAPVVYSYIAHSIRHFVTADEFQRTLRMNGFTLRQESRYLGGGIALVHALTR